MKNQPVIEAFRNFRFLNTPETLRYFYHPDHIGSTSWVTDSAKNGIQYCEYLPFGEPFLDQRSTTWNSRYTFSGKERDGETGYSYFGARYYNSDLSIWLNVDPMADKYPNLTPYAYCGNNPIVLVDPDGEEVEYNGLIDIIIIRIGRIFNSEFRKQFNVLKKSDEVYVFNHNKEGNNSFTTDGDKLYINYSSTEENKNCGNTIFSSLRHETEHANQFEYGEIGFARTGRGETGWEPLNYDVVDEYKAFDKQFLGTFFKTGEETENYQWEKYSPGQRIEKILNVYTNFNGDRNQYNNTNLKKIKTPMFYLLPKRERN